VAAGDPARTEQVADLITGDGGDRAAHQHERAVEMHDGAGFYINERNDGCADHG
jgi:hypothetical protein